MKRFILAVLFIVLFVQIGVSQSFDKEKLDAYFNVLDEGNKFMGSVAVSQNGSIIYSNSIGFADLENQTKASEITKYRIGSIPKTFTAVLVLKATEEDKLYLDLTIDKWFPAILNTNKITVSNLLNHRSGIHSFTN